MPEYQSKKGSSGLRQELRKACAIAGHTAGGLSLNQMVALVLEHGLPSLPEREALLAAKLEALEETEEGEETALPLSVDQSRSTEDDTQS